MTFPARPHYSILFSNVVWSMRSFLSVPTDCPQRDERLRWRGIALFGPVACLIYDCFGMFPKHCLEHGGQLGLRQRITLAQTTFQVIQRSRPLDGDSISRTFWKTFWRLLPLARADEGVLRDRASPIGGSLESEHVRGLRGITPS
jgi:hypothetical protein